VIHPCLYKIGFLRLHSGKQLTKSDDSPEAMIETTSIAFDACLAVITDKLTLSGQVNYGRLESGILQVRD